MQPHLERELILKWLSDNYGDSKRPSIWSVANYTLEDERSYSCLLWIKPAMTDTEVREMARSLTRFLKEKGLPIGEILCAEQARFT